MIEITENKVIQIEKGFEDKLRERFSPSEQKRVYDQRPIFKKLVNSIISKARKDSDY